MLVAHAVDLHHVAHSNVKKSIDLDRDKRLRVSKRDGRCFFDQLLLPGPLRRFMGRPRIFFNELLGAGMTLAEVQSCAESGTDLSCEVFWPVSRVCCM